MTSAEEGRIICWNFFLLYRACISYKDIFFCIPLFRDIFCRKSVLK